MAHILDRVTEDKSVNWEALKGSSILITGGTGLVGSVIVRILLYANKTSDADIRITLIVRDSNKAKRIYGEDFGDLNIIEADLCKGIDIDDRFDYIIHCVSITNSAMMVSNPVETIDTSYRGTYSMLECARKSGSKGMVYISSMEVYGVTTEDMNPVTEDKLGFVDLSNVRSSYQESKRICELLCTSYASEYDVPVCSARLAQTFGFGVSTEEKRIFAQFARSILSGNDIVLHTTGDSVGNYCDTLDMASAILCLLTNGAKGDSYNIANEDNSCRIKEMAGLCADRIAEGRIKVVFDIPDTNKFGYAPATCMRLDSSKMRSLGWAPQYSLEDMYAHLISYWNGSDLS